MQRISDSTISLGNDYNQPYASSYSAMTPQKMEYSKPEIVRKSGKSDIFHQMPILESPRRTVTDRNASTVFSRDPIPAARPGRKRSTYEGSDIFYQSKPSNHYEAAPSAEAYYESAAASYQPSSGPPLKPDFTADVLKSDEKVASGYAAQLPSLAAFEEKLSVDRKIKNQLPQQIHANIFSDQVDSIPSRGRRHYNSISAPTDIFNVSKREEMPRSRRDIPLLPDWKAGSSFSNLFGGSLDSLSKDVSRPRRNRVEPSNISRPSGLSSEDLNRDRVVPKGRFERSHDQFRSQIWF
jgi:hypothetical protein